MDPERDPEKPVGLLGLLKGLRFPLGIAAAVAAAFGGVVLGSFHFDDEPAVIEHLAVLNEDWGDWHRLFFGRGVVTNTLILCRRWADRGPGREPDPFPFHAMDLALHAAAAIALYSALRAWLRLARVRADDRWLAVGTLAWSLHPAISQGVAYIAQRGEPLCALFSFLSLRCFAAAWRAWRAAPGGWGSPLRLGAAAGGTILLAGLALGSKEHAVVLPGLLLLSAIVWERRTEAGGGLGPGQAARALLLHAALCLLLFLHPGASAPASALLAAAFGVLAAGKVRLIPGAEGAPLPRPFVHVALLLAALQALFLHNVGGQLGRNLDVSASAPHERSFEGSPEASRARSLAQRASDLTFRNEYFLTQGRVLALYAKTLLLPGRLNVDHDVDRVWSLRDAPDVLLLWCAWGGIALWAAVAVCARGSIAGFALLWAAAAIAPTSSVFLLSDAVFEHRLYLPAAGVAWLVAAFAQGARPRAALALATAALALLGLFTSWRVRIWRSERTLYADSVRNAPRGFRQRTNLGIGHEHEGEFQRAERQHLLSAEMFPRGMLWVKPFGNLGNVYQLTGHLDEAERCYRTVLTMTGDYKARAMLSRLWSLRADAAARAGDEARAREAREIALAEAMLAYRANPRDVRIQPFLEALVPAVTPSGGDPAAAFRMRLEAIDRAAQAEEEGRRLLAEGRAKEGIVRLDQAILLFPRLGSARAARGSARMDAGDDALAAEDLDAALRFPPVDPSAYQRLHALHRKRGDAEAAARVEALYRRDFPHLAYPRAWKP